MTMQSGYSAPFETSDSQAVEASASWLVSLMTGSVALGLCVLAIAVIGLLMFGGRLPVRDGLRVVLGCFVLLGAPAIAAAFVTAGQEISQVPGSPKPPRQPANPREDLPPSAFDPYAGASLRQD